MGNMRAARRKLARGRRIDLRPAGVAALVDGRLNAYKCPACRQCTVTVDLDRGATPAMLACRTTDGCQGTAFSLGYPPAGAWPAHVPTTPGWEWYRPDEDELGQMRAAEPDSYQHVVAGGLLLRPYRHGHSQPTKPAPPARPAPADRAAVVRGLQRILAIPPAVDASAEQPDASDVRAAVATGAVVTAEDLTPPADVGLLGLLRDAQRRGFIDRIRREDEARQ